MTNIEVRGKILNEKTKNLEVSTYTIYSKDFDYLDNSFLDNYYSKIDNYFINLDTITSFVFREIRKDLVIVNEVDPFKDTTEKITLKKGTPYVCLSRAMIDEDYRDQFFLIFLKVSEFHRFKRILTEKFCVK